MIYLISFSSFFLFISKANGIKVGPQHGASPNAQKPAGSNANQNASSGGCC
jgi:hypothetical protein